MKELHPPDAHTNVYPLTQKDRKKERLNVCVCMCVDTISPSNTKNNNTSVSQILHVLL